ncbi:hypothetical protein KUCAC02_035154 [Chaenocephalus aceratus]|nr:hypothetical protein KUCAC02_035154 [Chaenocephalus aceratus]
MSGPQNMMGHQVSGSPLGHPAPPGAQVTAAMLNYSNTKPCLLRGGARTPAASEHSESEQSRAADVAAATTASKQKNMNFRHIPHTQAVQSIGQRLCGRATGCLSSVVPAQEAALEPLLPEPLLSEPLLPEPLLSEPLLPRAPPPRAPPLRAPPPRAPPPRAPPLRAPPLRDQNSYAAPPPAPGNNPAMSSSSSGVPPGNHGNTGAPILSADPSSLRPILSQTHPLSDPSSLRPILSADPSSLRPILSQTHPLLSGPARTTDQSERFPSAARQQFTASSQPMGSVGSMGGPAPSQRMFPQNQGILGMSLGGGPSGGVAPPPTGSDISLTSCGGDVLYNNNSMQQPVAMTRQPLSAMATATYRHSLLAQQHLKGPPNASMLKQQQQINARMPGNMQSVAWQQQQLANQTPPFSSSSNAFHLQQQQRLSKMAPGGAASFGSIPGGRPMGSLNMMQNNMAAAQQRAAPNPQMSNQPQQQPQQQQQTANQSAAGLPDLAAFGQVVAGGGGRPGLQCNQGYQVTRTAAQQQQQVAFGYNVASGSFAGESELVDSLLKGHNAQEWMNDLDELLAGHH